VQLQRDLAYDFTWTLGAAQTLARRHGQRQRPCERRCVARSSIGTLTVNGDLTLNGNVLIEVNKSLAQSNDLTTVSGALNNSGSGSVIVSKLGPALVVGDKFTLFSQPVIGGLSMSVTAAAQRGRTI